MSSGASAQAYFGYPPNQHLYNQPLPDPNYEFLKTSADEKLDWAKFAMWLRGFLAGCEGKTLEAADVTKIMDKLAYVDPDKKLSYQDIWNQHSYTFNQTPLVNPYVNTVQGAATTSGISNANSKSPNINSTKLSSIAKQYANAVI